jgi:4-hydroxybutyryl-CoA dehydratase/vinylacetyl-CoA-Delta-isomerase
MTPDQYEASVKKMKPRVFMNQIIGAARLIQEYKGLEKAAHINEQLAEMVVLRETGRA